MGEDFGEILLGIPWEDVIFPKILALLSLKDCFSLRELSQQFQTLIDSYFGTLRSISKTDSGTIDASLLQILAEKTNKLEKLNLQFSRVTKENLKTIIKFNPGLTHVNLSQADLEETAYHPLINCQNLRQLVLLNDAPVIGCECLYTLMFHLKELDYLNVACLIHMDLVSSKIFMESQMKNYVTQYKKNKYDGGSMFVACIKRELQTKTGEFLFDNEGWLLPPDTAPHLATTSIKALHIRFSYSV